MTHLLLLIIYLAFISLGLPDSLIGAAWPSIQIDLNVPVSYAGIITMIICICTITSSLFVVRLIDKLGIGKIVVISVFLTAFALLGFSLSRKFYLLCIFAVPYGLGAGAIDASLNNYVATNFKAKHMGWLHCMWGIGATTGPYVMSLVLTNNKPWNDGYLIISIIQFALVLIFLLSLPLWKKKELVKKEISKTRKLSFKEAITTKGVIVVIIMFFCYCALEQTSILWVSSYLVGNNGLAVDDAAFFASMFFLGITFGRFLNGFLAIKFKDRHLIRLGYALILIGLIFMLINYNLILTNVGLILIGLGCAPIYPSTVHSIPKYFGEEKSQILIGIMMAGAYLGTLLMPPFFGIIAQNFNVNILPIYLVILLVILIFTHELLIKIIKKERTSLSLE